MADEGADSLSLLLTYKNMSFVDEITLPGDATQAPLDLIPGTEYAVRLRADNRDGMVITNAVFFTTLTGCKCDAAYYFMKLHDLTKLYV